MADFNLTNGNVKEGLSILKDPFSKPCITDITIKITTSIFSKEKYCYALVDFKNGNTTATQKIGKHTDFKVLMNELQAFIDSLEK